MFLYIYANAKFIHMVTPKNIDINFKNKKLIHLFTYVYQQNIYTYAEAINVGISFKNKKFIYFLAYILSTQKLNI